MELFEQLGWIPTLVILTVVTVICGVFLKLTAPESEKKPSKKKLAKMSDREKFEKYGIGEGPAPGQDPEEYWRDFDLHKQGGGREDEYFRDDQM